MKEDTVVEAIIARVDISIEVNRDGDKAAWCKSERRDGGRKDGSG